MDVQRSDVLGFLAGGGEMGARIRAFDWSQTTLGPPETWPQALRTAVRLILTTHHPMYIWWGPELLCLYNDSYRALMGPERHPESLGRPGRAVWAEIWDIISPQIQDVMAGRGAIWKENELIPFTRNGRKEDVYWTYSYGPIDDSQAPHGVGGVLVISTDTTTTVLAAKQRMQESERLGRMFEQAPGFIIIMRGPEHVVEFVNAAHRRLFRSDNWLDLPIRQAFPEIEAQGFFDLLDNVYRSGEPFVARSAPTTFRRPPNAAPETRLLDFVYAPLYGSDGHTTGVFCEGFDATEAHHGELALKAREEQLRLATEAADVGLWDVDVLNDSLFWTLRVKGMFGIAPDTRESMVDFYAGVHPEDRERVSQNYAAAADPTRRALYNEEYRVVSKQDGVLRWVAARGRGVFDERGRCVRMIGTVIDITTRKMTEEALRASRVKLEQSDRRKDAFLAVLSHELRNPLAPIRNAVALLERGPQDAAAADHALEVIRRQTEHLARLVDDLLDVTRIAQGKVDIQRGTLDLREVVWTTADDFRSVFDQARVELRVEHTGGALPVSGDRIRLAQVVGNLLHNAVKFTPSGGTVVVGIFAEAGFARVSVRDDGAGMDPSRVEQMFEPFEQGEQGLSRDKGGLGLGLALVKGLVEQHGGHVEASSEGPGRGAEFVIRLPLLRVSAPDQGRPERPQSSAHGRSIVTVEDDANTGEAVGAVLESGPERPKVPVHSRRIVIVEDNADAGETLAALLEFDGHQVEVAYDGGSGLAKVREAKPDMVICDIGLPDMSGFELARMIRTDPELQGVRLIALSGYGQPEAQAASRDAGFDTHLVKPLNLEALAHVLDEPD